MKYKRRKNNGFVFAEMIVGLTVLGILLACLAASINGFAKFNHYQMVKQRCISATQAQIDSIAVTGKSISEEDFKRLWPNLSYSIEKSPGLGQWEGLSLIKVKTSGKSFKKNVEVELSRYVTTEEEE